MMNLAGSVAAVAGSFELPGFVNAHSHTFQRALRGRAAAGDFWAWRDTMLAEAERQTPELVRRSYEATYREMRNAGFTAVGEFHYLGLPEAFAAVEAAAAAGIEIVLLHVAYARAASPVPPGVRRGVPPPGRGAPCGEGTRGARPPLRARVPRRVARRDRALWGGESSCLSTCTRTSSRRRSRNASPSMAVVRSSCSPTPAASASGRR